LVVENWKLEDWLLNAGEQAERKMLARGSDSLSPAERLVREVWLLDLEARNGGISQYFCNHGVERWQALREAWSADDVPSLGPIIGAIDQVIAGSDDPYSATLRASPGIEDVYETHQARMKSELRRFACATV
jgi:hypothetical protein